jgi:2-amino-4-hydroxy-6-hydroxymethyldihydropteridine diphosphokinase
MILIGLGANIPSDQFGPPADTLEAALLAIEDSGIEVTARSRLYESAPVPTSDQPWFVNCVVSVKTALEAPALLDLLLAIEQRFGRRRAARNAARVLDLDLLAYGDMTTEEGGTPELPHPRMHERAFVLLPLAEIAPDWCHPANGTALSGLIGALSADQTARPCLDQ